MENDPHDVCSSLDPDVQAGFENRAGRRLAAFAAVADDELTPRRPHRFRLRRPRTGRVQPPTRRRDRGQHAQTRARARHLLRPRARRLRRTHQRRQGHHLRRPVDLQHQGALIGLSRTNGGAVVKPCADQSAPRPGRAGWLTDAPLSSVRPQGRATEICVAWRGQLQCVLRQRTGRSMTPWQEGPSFHGSAHRSGCPACRLPRALPGSTETGTPNSRPVKEQLPVDRRPKHFRCPRVDTHRLCAVSPNHRTVRRPRFSERRKESRWTGKRFASTC